MKMTGLTRREIVKEGTGETLVKAQGTKLEVTRTLSCFVQEVKAIHKEVVSSFVLDTNDEKQKSRSLYNQEKAPTQTTSLDTKNFNNVWPKLKSNLCPKMVPNHISTNKLFSIAWRELELDDSKYEEIEIPMSFMFTFTSGASAYISPNEKPIIYLRIYKAANDQLTGWFQNVMGKQPGRLLRTGSKGMGYTGDVKENLKILYNNITQEYNWTMAEFN